MADKNDYLQDGRFISDARAFLYERTGDLYREPEEVLENFLEQRRVATVNEVSMLRDLEYAQEADDNGKQRFARLLDDFDAYDGDLGLSGLGDYAQGVVTSPLTAATAAVSFGAGAIAKTGAQLAGRQAAMAGLRKLLVPSTLGGAVRGAALGAAEGAATEEIYQRTREETGAGREEGMVGVVGAVGGVLGGGLGAMAGKAGSKVAAGAGETIKAFDDARASMNTAQKEAVTKVKALVDGGKKAQKKAKKETLRALDKEMVEEGNKLFSELNENVALSARLSPETIEAVSLAVANAASVIKREQGERITETVARGISEGKISVDGFKEILDTYKISREQFSAIFMADASEAGRRLQKAGADKSVVDAFKKKMDGAVNEKFMDITKDEMTALVEEPHQVASFMRGLDRLRLGMMTSQLATTVRNTAGGGLRLAVESFEAGTRNILNRMGIGKTRTATNVFEDTTSLSKFMFNQKDSSIVQMLFEETMPTKAKRLFFSAADAESRISRDALTGEKTTLAENFLSTVGHKVNILNTASDNIFKRAVFSASVDRQLRASGKDGVMDHIRKGTFADIDEDIIKKAMDESLEFTYQKMPSTDSMAGRLGNVLIAAHRSAPFIVSSLIPFPRFIVNQLKFVHDHSIVLPLLTKHMGIAKGLETDDYLAKSISGMMMYTAAVQLRASQPEDSKWHQYVKDNGEVVELAPILGPFAPFVIAADLHLKYMKGAPSADIMKYGQEMTKALGTPRLAPNSGWAAMDGFIDDLNSDMGARAAGRWLGEVAGTYTMPVAMLRDVQAALDPEKRGVREMEKLIPSEGDGMVDFWNYTAHYASRNMPVTIGEGMEEPVQYSPTAEGPLMRTKTIEKQLFGVATYKPKTVLQAELDYLGMDRRNLMPYEKDPLKAQTIEMLMGGGDEAVTSLSKLMTSYIYSDEYQNLPSEDKKMALTRKVKEVIGDAGYKEITQEKLEVDVAMDKPMRYTQDSRIRFEKLPEEIRKKVEREWLQSDAYIQQLIDNPAIDVGMSIHEAGAYSWALEKAEELQ